MRALSGYYDEQGRPRIWGRLSMHSLGKETPIHFLIDTGADVTTLLPADLEAMGLDFEMLPGPKLPSQGVGGEAEYKLLPVRIMFDSAGEGLVIYEVELSIISPTDTTNDIDTLPSLLGRDILDQWRMLYSKPTKRLSLRSIHHSRFYPYP